MTYLLRVTTLPEKVDATVFPFTLPIYAKGVDLSFKKNVTFFVGENGSGKSTLLEAIAEKSGFGLQGGNRDHAPNFEDWSSPLTTALRLSWRVKATSGFYLRAESFFNFATYLEEVGSNFRRYGGKSLHHQSHGESFLALFEHAFDTGLYLLDEPEAALSPSRQLTFLAILHELVRGGNAQFIIATHSPILLSYPESELLSFDGDSISKTTLEKTEHYQITKNFLNNPKSFLRHLFQENEDEA